MRSPLFTEAERPALDYATELARDNKMSPEAFDRLAAHYSEREICEIVYVVASEHIYNTTNISLNVGSDNQCNLIKKRMHEQTKMPVENQ